MSKPLMVHVITNFSGAGGVEMMLSRLIKETQKDYDHIIISLMEVSEIYRDTLNICTNYFALGWNWLNTLIVLYRLGKIIDELDPVNIQCWMYGANFMTSFSQLNCSKKRNVFWGIHHSLNALSEESISTKIGLFFNNILSNQPQGIIYCAMSSLTQHQKFGLANNNSCFIPNGVSLEDFKINLELNKPLVVGFAGRCHPAKGYRYLFDVISMLRNHPISFKVAGNGAVLKNPQIQEYLHDFNIDVNKVEFCGQISDMPEFYRSVDIFLMTSITEGFPNVLVEALASGLPCITTDVGDAKFIVQNLGKVVEPRDAEALSVAILEYMQLSNEEKIMLKNKARLRAELNFGISYISSKYVAFWQSI